jgi:hypothetical protein
VNRYFTWYRWLILLGVVGNLAFALPAIFAPDRLVKAMGLLPLASTIWVRNIGILLIDVSVLYAGSALDPRRYPLYSWTVALSRLIASVFFIRVVVFNATSWTEKPEAFLPLLVSDTTIGLVSGCLLYLAFRQDRRERLEPASATR